MIKDFEKRYGGDDEIKKGIVQLMIDRDNFGLGKYHCHLKINNRRSFYNDLVSELLDASVYSYGLLKEQESFNDNLYKMYTDILKTLVYLYELHERDYE